MGTGAVVGGRVGVASVAPSAFRREFYARYEAFGEISLADVVVGADPSTATFLGSDAGGISERSVNHATLSVATAALPASPSVWVRIPMDPDAREAVDLVVGIRVWF